MPARQAVPTSGRSEVGRSRVSPGPLAGPVIGYIRSMHTLPVYYTPAMVAWSGSYSPSAGKPEAVVKSWQALGIPLSIIPPTPVTRDDLARAHRASMVDGILAGTLDNGFGNRSPQVAASLPFTSGAMLCGARAALVNRKVAIAPCSGFHHACYGEPSAFCTFNGLMVTALALYAEGRAHRVGVLDFDQHYGNGTDDIIEKRGARWVVHFTAGRTYGAPHEAVEFLDRIPDLVATMRDCDVILYQAGADPHVDDPLGGWLTDAQLLERDRLVFRTALGLGVPLVWNLAGGYQEPLRKVLDIHDNTLRACAEVYLR